MGDRFGVMIQFMHDGLGVYGWFIWVDMCLNFSIGLA